MTETAGAKRSRITWSPEERAEWLWLFEQSGKNAAEFCRDNGLSPATLWLWRSQMPEVIDEPSGALVEVIPRLTPPSRPTSPVAAAKSVSSDRAVVQLPSGWQVDVPVGTDATWLRDLLQALASMKA